ncbi:uncharacterized protein PAC_05255 [Phialocephala subalpina]|uniref:F-box domain-containing protein n=1 Tax=Phialocephala subalpina TaxID=576137 RepID=A0A1L7WRI0_9HELO|nr:uncharacterized protein PAC_05255 [Phialocephala subalpina]
MMVRRGNRKDFIVRRPTSNATAPARSSTSATHHEILPPAVISSLATTPQSSVVSSAITSAIPSTYPSEDERENVSKAAKKPFPFLLLPAEIRNKIYGMVFSPCPTVIDLEPTTFRIINRNQLLALFSVCRQLHGEATHHFFSTHTFRIFPTYPGRHYKTKRPLLARLPARYRPSITTLELRFGPGWNNPPRGWVLNDALGLGDCTSARALKVFVECDPSDGFFAGFRKSEGFYEKFSADLLDGVLKEVPTIEVVEFDAWSFVNRTGDMMSGLGKVVVKYDKVVSWGPERGWAKESDQVWLDAVLMHGAGQKLSKTIAVLG